MTNATYFAQLPLTAAGIAAIYRWRTIERPLPDWAAPLCLLGALALAAAFWRVSFPSVAFFDFTDCYYAAGAAVLDGDTEALRALYERTVQGFVNMPVVAYLFAPFAEFSPRAAAMLYTVIGLGSTVAAWFLLARLARLELQERWVLALLFLVNGPLINGLKLANTSHIILLMLVSGLVLLRAGRSGAAGALLGAAAIMKPALLLFGIFFVLRRDVRGTLAFSVMGACTALVSLLLFGWEFNLFWFETSILQFSHHWFPTFSVQSIPGFLLRLRTEPGLLTSFEPRTQTTAEQLTAQVVVGMMYLTAAAACLRGALRDQPRDSGDTAARRDLQYLLVICLAVISSPLSWSHYYCWLLIPAGFFLGRLRTTGQTGSAWLGWTAIALVTPLVMWPTSFSSPGLMQSYQSLIESHLLLGGLVWFGLVVWWLAGPKLDALGKSPMVAAGAFH